MSLYSWIAALFVILATARAQSESESRPNGYAMPLSAAQCGCRTIQSKLDQQDQRILEMFNQQERKTESLIDQQDQRILEMFNQQEKKMESIFNGLLTKLDQLVEQRVAEKLDRNQNSTASILDGLFTKIEQLEDRISQIFAEQDNKTEAVLNGHVTTMDQLLDDRVSQMFERQQNGTEAILKELKQVIENDEDKILAQQNLTQQSAVSVCSNSNGSLPSVDNVNVSVRKCQQCQYVDTQFGPNWIVIFERIDDSGNFSRPWKDYRDGFGTVGQHFWLGLEKMHQLTKDSPYELAVEMADSKTGEKRYARYDSFEIGSEEQEYPIVKLGTHSGTAGDGLTSHKSASFSTYDSGKYIGHSMWFGGGGWWFADVTWFSYLTGARDSSFSWTGMWWHSFDTVESYAILSSVRMMIREI